jgi:hypothetical protein
MLIRYVRLSMYLELKSCIHYRVKIELIGKWILLQHDRSQVPCSPSHQYRLYCHLYRYNYVSRSLQAANRSPLLVLLPDMLARLPHIYISQV